MGEVRIIPSIAITETYNSNLKNVGKNQGIKSDFETLVSPGITINNVWSGFQLSGSYNANNYFYSRNPNLNYVGHRLNMSLNGTLSKRTSFSITDTFSITEGSLNVIDIGVQTRRTRVAANSVNISLANQVSPKTSVSIGLSERLTEYDDQTIFNFQGATSLGTQTGKANISANSANISLVHQLSLKTSMNIGLSESSTEYDNKALFDNRTAAADLSLNHQWTTEMSMNLSYSYSSYTFNKGENRNDDDSESVNMNIVYVKPFSPTFSANLSAGISYYAGFYDATVFVSQSNIEKMFKNSSLRLTYSRSTSTSTGLNNELKINDRVSVVNSYTFSKQMTLSINGTVSKKSSRPTGSDDTIYYSTGITSGWQVKSWMKLSFGWLHYEQKTDSLLAEDLSRDRVYINLTASYDG